MTRLIVYQDKDGLYHLSKKLDDPRPMTYKKVLAIGKKHTEILIYVRGQVL